MSPLSDLLPRAAGDDQPVGFDPTAVEHRVHRRIRQRRARAAASILVVVALGAGVVVLAGQRDDDPGPVAHDSAGPVTRDELVADIWIPVASSAVTGSLPSPSAPVGGDLRDGVTVIPSLPAPFLEVAADGRLRTFDGCNLLRADWRLDGHRLDIGALAGTDAPCTPANPLSDILLAQPRIGRPTQLPGSLELRAGSHVVSFERFDRLGVPPTGDDLLGTWTHHQIDGLTFSFRSDGTVRRTVAGDCEDIFPWTIDGDRLRVRPAVVESDCAITYDGPDPLADGSRVRLVGDWIYLTHTTRDAPFDHLSEEGPFVGLLRRPDPGADLPPHVRRPGEPLEEVVARVAAVVLDDPVELERIEGDGLGPPTIEVTTGSGVTLTARFTHDPVLDAVRLDRIDTPGLAAEEIGGDLSVEVPDPGQLRVTGYDGSLTPPGEVLIDGREGVRGTTDPLAIPESSWLHVQLTTDDGRRLHVLAPR